MTKDEVLARLTELGCQAKDAQAEWLSKLLVSTGIYGESIEAAYVSPRGSVTVISDLGRLVMMRVEPNGRFQGSSTLFLADIEHMEYILGNNEGTISIYGLGSGYSFTSNAMRIVRDEKVPNSFFKFYQELTAQFIAAKAGRR